MKSTRPDVGAILPLYLAAWDRPFDWSAANCGHFAAGWVHAATGRDARAAMPSASGLAGWRRSVQRAGGMERLVTECLRCPSVPAERAEPGDVVLLPGPHLGSLGIRLFAGAAVLRDEGAVVLRPHTEALCAWPLHAILAEAAS